VVSKTRLRMKVAVWAARLDNWLDSLDPQERERFTDSIGLVVSYVCLFPLQKRYYAKRGAPRWVAPAVSALAFNLQAIKFLLDRAEKQAIRERKAESKTDDLPIRVYND